MRSVKHHLLFFILLLPAALITGRLQAGQPQRVRKVQQVQQVQKVQQEQKVQQVRQVQKASSAVISCTIGNARPEDTLRLRIWDDNLSVMNFRDLPCRDLISVNNKGTFRFIIDSLSHPVYFSLSKDRNTTFAGYFSFISNYLLEPGDNISIHLDSLRPVYTHFYEFKDDVLTGYRFIHPDFTGKGSAKIECRYLLDSSVQHWMQKRGPQKPLEMPRKPDTAYYSTIPATFGRLLDDNASILVYQLNILEPYRKKISEMAWQIMRANLVGDLESIQLTLFAGYRKAPAQDSTISDDYKKNFTLTIRKVYEARKKVDMSGVPDSLLRYSTGYIGFLTDYASFAEAEKYFYLVKNYTGVFRDRLITDFLLKFVFYLKNNNEVLTDAVSLVKDPLCSKIITNMYDSQSVGRPAYDFSLRDIHGKTVRLSDFRGKIVFIDLWFTGCGACQGFYKYQLSRVEEHFRDDPNVVFITVSIDVHADQWTHSVESGDYSSPDKANVVNLYTNGEGADHPMIRAYNVKGYPHPFMIDRDGKIYKISQLQAVAEDLIPIIDKAIGFRS